MLVNIYYARAYYFMSLGNIISDFFINLPFTCLFLNDDTENNDAKNIIHF